MKIREIMEYCIEPGFCTVEVFSTEKDRNIWVGFGNQIPYEVGDLEIGSWDVPYEEGKITFNI